MEKGPLLRVDPEDNVAVALSPLAEGQKINQFNTELMVSDEIPVGHKISLMNLSSGDDVIRYGHPIGVAYKDIPRGSWVHKHNIETRLKKEQRDREYKPNFEDSESTEEKIPTFEGYKRENGLAGVRNEIWIVPTVGCANKIAEKVAESASEKYRTEIEEGEIDGIFSFSHPYGCSQLGEDLENTQKILAGLVNHPNAGGVLVVGLGCEENQVKGLKEKIGDYNNSRVKFVVLQEVEDDFKACGEKISELVKYAKGFQFESIPVSELKIGVKCGGSDAFSGLTANSLLGEISNRLIDYGGTSVITEIPELFGSEDILANRAENEKIHHEIIDTLQEFKEYFLSHGETIYENPSPGNEQGGLSTEEEKALGSVQKIGTRPIKDVLEYGDRIRKDGANLLESVSNDIVSVTALAAAGAQIVLFTTGRGTPYGSFVPTIKISTNSRLHKKKKEWIDFDAGVLLDEEKMENLADEFFNFILDVASDKKKAKNERNGCREISIWKTGITL